jgi:hypothetical protein
LELRRKGMFSYFKEQQEINRKEKQEQKEMNTKYGKFYTTGESITIWAVVAGSIALFIGYAIENARAARHIITVLQYDADAMLLMFVGLMLFVMAVCVYAGALKRRINTLYKALKDK